MQIAVYEVVFFFNDEILFISASEMKPATVQQPLCKGRDIHVCAVLSFDSIT